MMQKMVSLPSEQPEGSLVLAPALPSLCIRKEHRQKSIATSTWLSTERASCLFADVWVSHPWLKAAPCPFVAEGQVTVQFRAEMLLSKVKL